MTYKLRRQGRQRRPLRLVLAGLLVLQATGSTSSAAAAGTARVDAGIAAASFTHPGAVAAAPIASAGVSAGDPFGGAPAPAEAQPADAPVAVDPTAGGPGVPDPTGVEPTIQYEQALVHEGDPNRFSPGGTVTVGFTPRADDGWAVGGGSPDALPPGNASGRVMARAAQGSDWAARPPAGGGSTATSPVDGPYSTPTLANPAIAAPPADATQAGANATAHLRRQVFGFLPYWTLGDSSTVLNYRLLSTISYFSVGTDRAGNLLKRTSDGSATTGWGGWTSSALTNVINAAHRDRTRVVLTISMFGWTTGEAANQGAFLGDTRARHNLARQAAAAVRDRGADGINLDFEPIAPGHAADFTAFVRQVRRELNRIHRGYQLTFDTTGWIGNYPIEDATAPGGADAIFIMGYDYRTSGSTTAGSIDPLEGSGYTLADTIRAYTARVPASKLILGLPYYGRAWSTPTNALRAPNQSGELYGNSAPVTYDNAIDLLHVYGRKFDPTAQAAWFVYPRKTCTPGHGCVKTWRQVYFNDAQAMKARYDLIIRNKLRGAGIWALGYDGRHSELYGALALKFLHDTTPPVTGVAILPSKTGDAGFVVTWQATDDSKIRSYDVELSADGGPWAPWLTGAKTTSAVYLGADGHGYAFRARATDVHGNVGTWDVTSRYDPTPSLAVGGFGVVKVDGIGLRVSPDTSSLRVATLDAGQVLAIIGGPKSANGYTWYKVTGPLGEWNTVGFTRSDVWVAARSASASFVGAAQAPNATFIQAGIAGLTVGDPGTAAAGASAGAPPTAAVDRVFSPNGDGARDTIRLGWMNQVAFDSMTLRILRPDGTLVGTRPLPDRAIGTQTYDWDGRVEGAGDLADGTYMIQLVGVAGSKTYTAPSARPATPAQVALYGLTIDRVPPKAIAFSASGSRISPDGDGRFDRLVFSLTASGGTSWTLAVTPLGSPAQATAVRTVSGTGTKATVTWDGKDDAGVAVPDGMYRATLAIADPAGNQAAHTWTVTVDARNPTIIATASPVSFSPNGDGSADRVVEIWLSDKTVSGTVTVRAGASVIRGWPFAGRAGGSISWNGRDSGGRYVPDGTYMLHIDAIDATGNRAVKDVSVVVDRTLGFLRWTPIAFYPQDGDRLAATAKVGVRLTRPAVVSLAIYDASGSIVRSVWSGRSFGAGTVGWAWDGKSDSGGWAPSGTYVAVMTAKTSRGTTTLTRAIFVGAFAISASSTNLSAGQKLTITFQSVEPLSGRPTVTLAQTGLKPAVQTATVLSGGSFRATFAIAKGAGPASVTIAAKDHAGHVNGSTLALTIR